MIDILYVEDDDLLRELYADALRDAGFSVRELRLAADGLDAIRRATPDLVLLDLAMPLGQMSGIEFLAQLRESEIGTSTIPTVVISGLGKILNPEFVRSLRVAAVVAKPARASHLVDVVRRVLEVESRRRDALSGSRAP